mgnify:FL=1|jgi:hypothetical protein
MPEWIEGRICPECRSHRNRLFKMVKRGYVKVPRSVFESEEWAKKRRFSRFEAMMSLYEQAAYTDGRLMHVRGVDVLLRRGQMVVSIRSLAALWGWSKSSVDRFLKKMRDEKRDDLRIDINMVSGTAYLIVTVCESYNYEDVPTMCGTVSGGGTATGTEGDAVGGTATGTATGTDEKCASDSIREYCECNDSEIGTATGTEGDAVGGTEGDAVSGTYTSYRKKDSKKDKKEKKEIPHTQLLRDFKNACARADTREAAFACFKELLDRGFFDSEESAMLPDEYKLLAWLWLYYPALQRKFDAPLIAWQARKIIEDYGGPDKDISRVIERMANTKGIETKYNSFYSTLRQWLKSDFVRKEREAQNKN